jgi:enoyl-CoA hydratase/carnithine racemase
MDLVLVDRPQPHTALVTLNRPDRLNAMSIDLVIELHDALAEVAEDNDTWVVVLTGSGRGFCSGLDLKDYGVIPNIDGLSVGRIAQRSMRYYSRLVPLMRRMPQPVIAAVNGYAFGGGCELAIACDIRLASDNARFAQPEVSLGIPPGWGGTQRLPRLIGPGFAAEMIYTGRQVDAAEALRTGLVNAVHPLDRLMPAAQEMAAVMARNSPAAVRAAKNLIALSFTGDPAAGLAAEVASFGAAFAAPDRSEGMRAFVEKRAADFAAD